MLEAIICEQRQQFSFQSGQDLSVARPGVISEATDPEFCVPIPLLARLFGRTVCISMSWDGRGRGRVAGADITCRN